MTIGVEPISAPTSEARGLLAELDQILDAAYEPHQRHGLSVDQIFQPGVHFFIARLGGAPVGCSGVALYRDYAEVKRMYTRKMARGLGVGKALLAQIEAAARDGGKRVLRVETGVHQVAAIGLYKGWAFRQCGPFGHYANLPPDAIVNSVFYEKPL